MKKYFNRKALKYAFCNPVNAAMLPLLFIVAVVTAIFASFSESWNLITIFLILAVLVASFILMYSALKEWLSADCLNKFALLRNWVKDAGTKAERARRIALMDGLDVDSAFAASGLSSPEWTVNTNGMLMLAGTGIDTSGELLGATLSVFHFNESADLFSNPFESFQGPIGLNNDDFLHM